MAERFASVSEDKLCEKMYNKTMGYLILMILWFHNNFINMIFFNYLYYIHISVKCSVSWPFCRFMKGTSCCVMRRNFKKFCEYEFIICYFVSHALIKTTRTSGALPKVGENRLRDQPKEYRGHRQTEKRRLIDLSAILKALFPFPVAFLRQITCHIEVLMVSIFFSTLRSLVLGCHRIRDFGW